MKKVLLFILICLPLCFCGCQNENKQKLDTPQNLTVEPGGVITFERVKGDQYYSVVIDDDLVFSISINGANVQLDNNNISSNVELFNENNKNYLSFNASTVFVVGESYMVKVSAAADGKKDSDFCQPVKYVHTMKLQAPQNIQINGNELIWNEVLNASSYQVKIVSPSNLETITTCLDNRFNFASILTEAGEYSFAVSALSASNQNSASDFSIKAYYTNKMQLSTPKLSSIYRENDAVHVIAVLDAKTDKILLNINGKTEEIALKNLSGVAQQLDADNVWDFNLTNYFNFANSQQYAVSVTATGNRAYYIDSAESEQKTFNNSKVLIQPNLVLNGKVLKYTPTAEELQELNSALVAGYQINLATASGIKTITNIPKNCFEFELDSLEDVWAASVTKLSANSYNISSVSNWVSAATSVQTFSVETAGANVYWAGDANYYIVDLDGTFIPPRLQNVLNLTNYGDVQTCKITAVKQGYAPSTELVETNYTLQLRAPILGQDPSHPYELQFSPVDNALGYFVYLKLDSNEAEDYERIDHLFTETKIDLTNYVMHSNKFGQYSVKLMAVASGYERYGKFINSELSNSLTIQHKRQLNPPQFIYSKETQSPITKLNDKYYLNFAGSADAFKYELSINAYPIEIDNDAADYVYSVDVTDFLKDAGNYTFKLRAISKDEFVESSLYAQYDYTLFLQLNEVGNIAVVDNDGKYILTFDTQINANSYLVNIVNISVGNYNEYLSSLGLSNPFNVSQPTDISRYLSLAGEYYIYVTALASPGSSYSDSAISSQPAYLNKLSSLPTPTNLSHNNIDENTFNLTWQAVVNADYYTIKIVNIFGEVKQINSLENRANINAYITLPGQYKVTVKAVAESSNSTYLSSAYSHEYIIDYDFVEDWDFLRYSINFNGNSYNYQIETAEDLVAILWYHYIFDIDPNYGLKIKIKPNEGESTKQAILRFADEGENIYNFNEDKDFVDKKNFNAQESELFRIVCNRLLSAYPEYNVLSEFSCENVEPSIYKLYYVNAINLSETNEAAVMSEKDYGNKFTYLLPYVRRSENATFAIDQKPEMYVTTSQQLLFAIINGFKPHFVGNSQNAELIYNNAKAVLRATVRANMTDYDKALTIFNWLEYAFKLNHHATYVDGEESMDVQAFGGRFDFYLEGVLLNLLDADHGGFDGEFYLGTGSATSYSYSKAFSLLCGIEGIKTDLIFGKLQNNKNHVWNKIYLATDEDANWFVVDLTYSDNYVGELNAQNGCELSSHLYFLVSDSFHKTTLNVEESKINKEIVCNTNFDYYANSTFGLTDDEILSLQEITLGEQFSSFKYFATYDAGTTYNPHSTELDNAQAFMLNALIYAKYKQKFVNNSNLAMFEIKIATNLIPDGGLSQVVESLNQLLVPEQRLKVNIVGGNSGVADTSQNTATFIFTIENTN